MARTDAETGVWAQVTTRERLWGSDIEVEVKDAKGPRSCELVAIGKDGSEQSVTSWMEPADNEAPSRCRAARRCGPTRSAGSRCARRTANTS